jgi:hypothetical protein
MSTEAVVPPDPGNPEPEQDVVKLLEQLAAAAPQIVAELDALSEASGNQFVSLATQSERNGRQIRRTRRLTWTLAVSVLLDILLSVSMILVVIQVRHNENANAANQAATAALAHRLDVAQTTTRQKTLCPLYGVLLAAKNPKARAVFPQGPAAYDHTFAVIKQGYDALGCAAFVIQPPKSG